MEHPTYFDNFLRNTVNINQSRLDELDTSVNALYDVLKADPEVGPHITGKTKQGSWAYRTIIKPVGSREFDADILLHFKEVPGWSASDYINKVYAALERHARYRGKNSRKARCNRVAYANKYHVDVVPEVHLDDGRTVICNRDIDDFENSNPAGFATWFNEKDGIANGNLRRSIRILKYLRDHKGTFSTPSVILTTLVANQVESYDTIIVPGCYDNTPKTLLTVVESLDTYLKNNPWKPSIPVPGGAGETFDHRWDGDDYLNLCRRIDSYAAKMRDAFDESDKSTSVDKWQELFGGGFCAPPSTSTSGKYGATAAASSSVVRSGRAG